MKWYATKTIYKTKVKGSPKFGKKYYIKKSSFIEERVVIFQARDVDEAESKAYKEAEKYCEEQYVNPFGQSVETKFLNITDTVEIYDDIENGAEIYSMTERFDRVIKNKEAIERRMGNTLEKRLDKKIKFKYLNRNFNKKLVEKFQKDQS